MNSYEKIYTLLIEEMTPTSHKIVKAQKGLTPKQIRKMNRLMTTRTKGGGWRSLEQARKGALKEFRSTKHSEEEIKAARDRARTLGDADYEMMFSQTRSGKGKENRKAIFKAMKKAIAKYREMKDK